MKTSKIIASMSIFYVLFYISWTISRLLILPAIDGLFGAGSLPSSICELILKACIWVLPVILILKREGLTPLSYLKFNFKLKNNIIIGIICGIALSSFKLFRAGGLNFDLTYTDLINTVIFVGIIEEITFRGFLQQKIKAMTSFWPSAIIICVLFAIIHIPILIYNGSPILSSLASISVLSLGFSYLFEETNSIIPGIIVHSIWNLSVVLSK